MAQANVYTSASAQAWFTDKCRISTGNNTVTYNVNIIYPTAVGNIFSNAAVIPANWQTDVWVGVGNELTVVGGNVTLQFEVTKTNQSIYIAAGLAGVRTCPPSAVRGVRMGGRGLARCSC